MNLRYFKLEEFDSKMNHLTIYCVYKTTNLLNGMYYYGCFRVTSKNKNGYLGSGRALKKDIKKYGRESFKRENIKLFDNKQEAFEYESFLVNDKVVNDPNSYNKVKGGEKIGFSFINRNKEARQKGRNNRFKNPKIRGRHHYTWKGFIIGVNPKTDEIVERFETQSEAARHGYSQGNIRMVINGQRSIHKGLVWYYEKDYETAIL